MWSDLFVLQNDSDSQNTSPTKQNSTKAKKAKASAAPTNGSSEHDKDAGSVLYNGEPIASVCTVPSKLKHLSTSQHTVAYPSMKQKGDIQLEDEETQVKTTPLKAQNVSLV